MNQRIYDNLSFLFHCIDSDLIRIGWDPEIKPEVRMALESTLETTIQELRLIKREAQHHIVNNKDAA